MRSSFRSLSLFLAVAVVCSRSAQAQSPCSRVSSSPDVSLPRFAQILPPGNLSLGGSDRYLYAMTQWGFARASLADPAHPSGFSQVIIVEEPGTGSGGLIKVTCDCHQGGSTFDAAEAPDGSSRMISDYRAGTLSSLLAPAEVARTDGGGGVRFGQQAYAAAGGGGTIPLGSRTAAIYIPTSGKYFGYLPTSAGVATVDMTNTNSNTARSASLSPVHVLNWPASSPIRLNAARVNIGGDLYLLAGATGSTLRIASIDPNSGIPSEKASIAAAKTPVWLAIAAVNGRVFLFSAEGTEGLRVYEYVPSSFGGTLTPAGVIPGNFDRAIVRGGRFPVIFAHNKLTLLDSVIEVWDTNWLTEGGTPRKATSLPQAGGGRLYLNNDYEVVFKSGSTLAYVYRNKSAGIPNEEPLIATDVLDLSCISANVTSPPLPSASLTNVSAANRSGTEASTNYYGDRWRVRDSSSTGVPLDQIEWDWNVASTPSPTFQADAAPTFSGVLPNAALTDFNQVFFPCDPSAGVAGNPLTGANCYGSVNSPAGTADFRIGVRSHNSNGWPALPFISSALTIQAPSVQVAGFSGGNLRVLSGGQIDARGSQGNVADATFQWNFFDQAGQLGNDVGSPTGSLVNLPAASRSFRLTVTYGGGYRAPVINGAIQQVDLVPDFSVTPAAVLHGTPVTLTNQMQKGASATVNAVRYEITSSATAPASFGNALPSSFFAAGGTAQVTAPAADGAFYAHLQYDFSGPQGANQLLSVSKAFSTTSFAPRPSVIVYLDATKQSTPFYSGGFQLQTGATYYLFDVETLPVGVAHPGAQFYFSTNRTMTSTAGDQLIGSSSTDGPVQFTASSACSGCSVKAVVEGATNGSSITVSTPSGGGGGGGGTGGGGGGTGGGGGGGTTPLSASLSCPAQGATGSALTCTASATGGTPPYSYLWNWGDSFTQYQAGPATHSHTYTTPGPFSIAVQVSGGGQSASANASVNIVQSGPPRPSAANTVLGATLGLGGSYGVEAGQAVTLTASESDPGATFRWEVTGGPTSPTGPFTDRSVRFAFATPGTRSVALTVTGGGTVTSGVTSTQIRFSVSPPRFQALMIPGAGHIDPVPPAIDGTWATDISITNPGTQPMTLTLDFESFGTAFPADLSLIPFNSVNSVPLSAGQSWSATDVVKTSLAKNGRGVLIIKYEGGNSDPIATATVYYTQQGRAFGSSLPTFRVGPYGTTTQSLEAASEQTLVGLRNDGSYRFNVSLFNASGQSGAFQLSAFSDDGVQVPLLDETGASVMSRQFPIGAFQQTLVQSGELGLTDSTKRYVLKASPVSSTGGGLIAAASALDRRNNDLVQVSDDTPRIAAAADALVDYFIPGVGRIGRDDVADGPHWKTDLTLYSNSSQSRDLIFEYRYTDTNGVEQRVLSPVTVGAGKSVILDDVVGSVLARYAPVGVDLKQVSTLGLLRISYRAASDSSTAPLLIGGRIYDDRGTAGTAGMQLFVYSNGESVSLGSPLVLPGAQQNLRFRTNIGFFAMGDLPTHVRVTAVKPDGTEGGRFEFLLNDPTRSGHYVQVPMSAIPGIVGEPMTIKVEVLEGSRVGAYVVTVDQISSDSIFVQGRPTRLAN